MGRVVAVILCAGQGTRMGAGENKVFLDLAGCPVLLWSLDAFTRSTVVDDILLVAHPAEIVRVKALAETAHSPKLAGVIAGGTTRAGSETRALDWLRPRINAGSVTQVMFHDGARPLVTPKEIERLSAATAGLLHPGGALLAASVDPSEEIGEVAANGTLARLFDARELARAQTPQAFDAALLLAAYDRAASDGFDGTDTAATFERLGAPVIIVSGSSENIKLTTPDDLARAEAIIAARRHM